MLDKAGANELEIGIPAMGKDERAAIKEIVSLGLNARCMTWNRATPKDLEFSLYVALKPLICLFQHLTL